MRGEAKSKAGYAKRFAMWSFLMSIWMFAGLQFYDLPLLKTRQDFSRQKTVDATGTFTPTKIAIIGGAGYVGSYLASDLKSKAGFDVTIFDKNPKLGSDFNSFIPLIKVHSTSLTQTDLSPFGTVIFLGGCTGRYACDQLSPEKVEEENISNVIDVLKKMSSPQHFIAASTSAVTEGTFGAKEDAPLNLSLLDTYSFSMFKRETRLKEFVENDKKGEYPKVSLLRFGTVVGNSAGQRTDLMVPSFFRSAYTTGFLKIDGHNTMRSFLTLKDCSNAFITLIQKTIQHPQSFGIKYRVWNLASFDATVFKVASTVASLTGAAIDSNKGSSTKSTPLLSMVSGFSLDCEAFQKFFNFSFSDTLEISIREFDSNIPNSIIPKGPHSPKWDSGSFMPCPVCGSRDPQIVLDLGSQPLANDFYPNRNDAMARPRFPLKLVRCRVCNHYHLSHVVDRSDLFEHYLYQSGTSLTLSKYFEWLALKVIQESSNSLPPGTPGSILEIACNDGSQLDHYKTKGWKTFGVDPASNLAAIAGINHTVMTGFWPLDFPELPRGDKLTAITAQNVAAHVPDVVAFLKGCAAVMGENTKLYIQTSQCNMQQLGQFDTVYHEHISFFTGHSFLKASELAGLKITKFETTPIHGESCLVTMQLDSKSTVAESNLAPTLKSRLDLEQKQLVTSDFFAIKFSVHANRIREWIKEELLKFKEQGYTVFGYGAAAKGMVLLHFILQGKDTGLSYLDFVVDDAKLKQNTFCPGTEIPVKPTSSISELGNSNKPIVVLVFAWNFFDEISKRIVAALKRSHKQVLFLVPFPSPKIIRVDMTRESSFDVLGELLHNPTPIPNPITNDEQRPKVTMITHQRNEELLMPFFIMSHAHMFDKVKLIDFDSDDRTLEIIHRFAPPSWEVIPSSTGSSFDAQKTDDQVVNQEKLHPNDWHIALTTTEFLIAPNFRQSLSKITASDKQRNSFVGNINFISVTGNNGQPLLYSIPLPKQHHAGYYGYKFFEKWRFLHYNTTDNYKYQIGRHKYSGKGAKDVNVNAFILKFRWAPWPQMKKRKMAVGETISDHDKKKGYGSHHINYHKNSTLLDLDYQEAVGRADIQELCRDNIVGEFHDEWYFMRGVYRQVFGRCTPAGGI